MTISSSSRPPTIASEPHQRFMRRHPLICYFLLAYGLSWLVWSPYVLSQNGLGLLPLRIPEMLSIIPGAYLGPLLAGFS